MLAVHRRSGRDGALLLLERFVLSRVLEKLPGALRWVLTMLLVVVGWVIFYYTDFSAVKEHLMAMIGLAKYADGYYRAALLDAAARAACTAAWAPLRMPFDRPCIYCSPACRPDDAVSTDDKAFRMVWARFFAVCAHACPALFRAVSMPWRNAAARFAPSSLDMVRAKASTAALLTV